VFVANALLDAFEQAGDARHLDMAVSAAEYLYQDLYWTGAEGRAGFSYPAPWVRVPIHNANFLGAALLSRVAAASGETRFLEAASRVADYSAACQAADGSWRYGEGRTQGWIDNFHTGYNLCALRQMARVLDTGRFDATICSGFEFYRAHFFRADGAPRYYHDRTYPIDIHCVAQALITLITLRDLDPGNVPLAQKVFEWAARHMWDPQGFFYYRALRFGTIKTSYMRWSQAWMLLAMAELANADGAASRATSSGRREPQ
jgi:mannose/cellobiose epimerase-like protein (N-acyl-D-glucosamine 2-epimerase family)